MMINFTPVSALLGGLLIGLSATFLLLLNGRIAGISGIFHQLGRPSAANVWRYTSVVGMLLGGGGYYWLAPHAMVPREGFPVAALIVAGVLVGFGTRMGSGCTSGHGICGIGRLSARSAVATAVFVAFGVASAVFSRHVLGVGL